MPIILMDHSLHLELINSYFFLKKHYHEYQLKQKNKHLKNLKRKLTDKQYIGKDQTTKDSQWCTHIYIYICIYLKMTAYKSE